MQKWKAELLLIYVAFSWGLGFPLMKIVLDDNDTFTVLWLRFSMSALMFVPFVLLTKQKMSKGTLLLGLVLGSLLFLTFSLFIVGLNYTSSVNTGFLAGLGIIFVPLILAIIQRKLPKIDRIISAVLGLSGLVIISELNFSGINLGDSLVMLGAISSSIHIIVLDKFAKQHDATLLTFLQLLVMAVLSLGVSSATGNLLPREFTSELLISVGVTAIFATTLAFWVQTKYQSQTSADRAVLIFSLEPIFAAIFSALLLEEILSSNLIVGGGAIFLAMIYPVIHGKLSEKFELKTS